MTNPAEIERSCRGKHRYATEKEAHEVAAKCFAARGTWLRAYFCDEAGGCGGWHLTHTNALPPANANWRPPAKSQRQIAAERTNARRRRRR